MRNDKQAPLSGELGARPSSNCCLAVMEGMLTILVQVAQVWPENGEGQHPPTQLLQMHLHWMWRS